MPNLKVEKKDGQTEEFQRLKLVNSIIKAGTTNEDAEKIATQVETWAKETAESEVIKTSAIKIKVIELLRSLNPAVATAYETYKKPV